MEFYKLEPDEKYADVRYAKDNKWESIICPVYEGHQRASNRVGELVVKIIGKGESDFYWTFSRECLITDKLAQLFKEACFTGYKLKPVQVINKDLILWEFIIIGKGGDVCAINDIIVKDYCSYCNHIEYSDFSHGLRIDEAQWDGSDFFTVWPLPRFILITSRVKDFILAHKFRGVKIVHVHELIGKGKEGGLAPGSYEEWLNIK